MKKTILMTIVLVMILSIASVVNAAEYTAELSTGTSEVITGQTAIVRIHTSEKVQTANFRLKYDKSFLKFEKLVIPDGDMTSTNDSYSDGVNLNYISAGDGIQDFEIRFTVIGTEGQTTVTAVPNLFYIDEETTLDVSAITGSYTFKIKEVAEQPVNNTVTNNTVNNTVTNNTVNNTVTNKTNTNTNAEKPDHLPQTGAVVPYSAIATVGIVLILTVGAVAYYKMKK